jgi:hypothetical protein
VFGIDKNFRPRSLEAMQHMQHWVENFTARVAGDDMDPQKGIAKLLEFLLRDIEGGRTLPEGWDAGLTDEQLGTRRSPRSPRRTRPSAGTSSAPASGSPSRSR